MNKRIDPDMNPNQLSPEDDEPLTGPKSTPKPKPKPANAKVVFISIISIVTLTGAAYILKPWEEKPFTPPERTELKAEPAPPAPPTLQPGGLQQDATVPATDVPPSENGETPPSDTAVTADPVPSPNGVTATVLGLAPPPSPPSDGSAPKVTCYVDTPTASDTIRVNCGTLSAPDIRVISFYCIEAPKQKHGQWGTWSNKYLESILKPGAEVWIDKREGIPAAEGTARVRFRGLDMSAELARYGIAAVIPNCLTVPDLNEAQSAAQRTRSGIWSVEGAQQTPWL